MGDTVYRVIKNTGFLYIRLASTIIISLWTTRIILNALGVDNFGIYSLVGGIISLLGFVNGSLSTATQRFMNFAEGKNSLFDKKIIYNTSIILHLIFALILIIVFIIIGFIAFKFILYIPADKIFAAKCVYCCMIFSTVLTMINIPYEAIINAHEDMGYYASVGIIDVILKLVIAYTIKYCSYDRLIIYGILMSCVPIITLTIMKIYCIHKYQECELKPRIYFRKQILINLGKFAMWNFSNVASGIITQSGFNFLLNYFFGVAINAAQGIANQVCGVLINISSNALKALNPIIVKSESSNQRNRMLYVSNLGCRATFASFCLFSIPMIAEMNAILHLWLNNVPNWAVLFCQLQLIRVSTEMLTFGLSSAILAEGNIKRYNMYRSIFNLMPLIFVYILFKFGAAPYWLYIIWTFFWSIIGGWINIYYAHKNVGLNYSLFFKEVIYPCIATAIIPTLIVSIIYSVSDIIAVRISSLVIGEIVFLIFSWRLIIQNQERIELSNLFKRIIKFK